MLFALLLAAQAPAAEVPDLSRFKPFLGACWRTEFSATVHDTHCFDTLYDGAHVRDRHEVQEAGKTVYAGVTTYSADAGDILFVYLNSLGGFGQGKVRTEGAKLRFVGMMRASPDKAQQPVDSQWKLIDANHYEVRSLVNASGAPKALTFTRIERTKSP